MENIENALWDNVSRTKVRFVVEREHFMENIENALWDKVSRTKVRFVVERKHLMENVLKVYPLTISFPVSAPLSTTLKLSKPS